MNARNHRLACAAALCVMASVSTFVLAQGPPAPAGPGAAGPAAAAGPGGRGGPGGQGGGPGRGAFIPEPVPPPQNFATSTEHYQFLFRLHKGGTRHTYESVPKWEGLWTATRQPRSS
jgi:hypothetical protein